MTLHTRNRAYAIPWSRIVQTLIRMCGPESQGGVNNHAEGTEIPVDDRFTELPQNFTVNHPMTRLPIVSPNGCSLCLSFNALKAVTATSASRRYSVTLTSCQNRKAPRRFTR